MVLDTITNEKQHISEIIRQFLLGRQRDLEHVGPWAADLLPRLRDYTTRGKMIRGALVGIGARAMVRPDRVLSADEVLLSRQVGAGMELLQSLLLIHDDIMDRDLVRRGVPSVHAQYTDLARAGSLADPGHLGQSLGICAGDVAGFLAFELLADLPTAPATIKDLLLLFSRELSMVGLAQMADVYGSASDEENGLEEIFRVYRYKTGRYTFSLPLEAGCLIAGATKASRTAMGKFGEAVGIVFQLKDDEIGLFSDAEKSGKPFGSDILENKKTLYRHYLFASVDVAERKELASIFGKREAGSARAAAVVRRIEELGIRDTVAAEIETHANRARTALEEIEDLNETGRRSLLELLDYNLKRES